jgi:ABC-2 type transport system permease protein
MLATSQAAAASEQLPAQAAAQPKRPRTNRFTNLRVHLANIYPLMIKELRGLRSNPIMLLLVAYSFTFAINTAATGASTEATNLSVGIVDIIPICRARLRMASRHRPSSRPCRSRRVKSTRR